MWSRRWAEPEPTNAMATGRHSIRMAAFAFAAFVGWSPTATAQPYHPDSFAIVLAPADTAGDPGRAAAILCQRLQGMTLRHHAVAVADADRLIALVPARLYDLVDPDPLTARGNVSFHAVIDQAPTPDSLPPDGESLVLTDSRPGSTTTYRLAAEPIVDHAQVVNAEATFDYDRPAINLGLDDDGTRRFAAHTGGHIGEAVAIVLDGAVISAPVIRERIAGGRILISGFDDPGQVSRWAAILNAPPLDPPLERTDFLSLDSLKAAVRGDEIDIIVQDACIAG